MNTKRFSKLNMPKMGKRPMMMALTALIIIFLFWFFFMRNGSSMSEGFREGNAASEKAKQATQLASGKIDAKNEKQQQIKKQELDRIAKEKAEKAARAAKEVKAPKKAGKK